MQQDALQRKHVPQGWWRILLLLLLIMTIVFRFANLDQKIYTVDEVRGLLRISGYTSQEFVERVFQGQTVTAAEIQRYQQPNAEKSLGDAVQALAGNPEHPPLYYLLARFGIQGMGNPVGARVLTAIVSLLVFPALYWLCLELFESPLAGWIAIALVAVSPFHLMLAQEARQYSFWTLAIVLSSALLLRCLRQPHRQGWVLYGATVALGIYSHLFFALVMLAHGVYVLTRERFRLGKALIPYLLASLAGLVSFLPWVWVVMTSLTRLGTTTKWVAAFKISPKERLETWLYNLSVGFVDFNLEPDFKNPLPYLVLVLIGAAIYTLCRYAPWRTWLFILLLMGVPALAQVLPDLVKGGRRSLLSRYLVPSYLGIELAVAFLLMVGIASIPRRWWHQRLWQGVLALVLTLGVISCASSAQARDWWKGSSSINLQVAAIANQAPQPLIISDASHTFILPLSYLLDPSVRLQLFSKEKPPSVEKLAKGDRAGSVFLYFPSPDLLSQITRQGYKTAVAVGESRWVKGRNWLYRLEKQ